jgi:hypothetical protein
MQLIAKQCYTPEEYLELEATADYKSEYIDGQIIFPHIKSAVENSTS